MSVTILSRVMWTQFDNIEYQSKGKTVKVGKSSAKLVMLAIADSADDFGENSWQSFDTIAQKASVERRSVIRIIRGLIEHSYLSLSGSSRYGTNDYKIALDKLGHAPEKRAQNGRPKTSDSGVITSDSVTETSDSSAKSSDIESPYPSYNHPNPSNKPAKKGDLVDGMIDFAFSGGVKTAILKQAIESEIKVQLGMNPSGKDAESFVTYAAKEHKAGNDFKTFVRWWKENGGEKKYWSFRRMEQMYPMAFTTTQSKQPAVENGAFYA